MNLKITQDVMESTSEVAKTFNVIPEDNAENNDSDDNFVKVFQNQNYLNQLSELMDNISDKGATIAQLKDGTVFVSETRIVVFKYIWDAKKGTFIKQRTRNTRSNVRNRMEPENMMDEDAE